MCIISKFSGNADAAGPAATLWEPQLLNADKCKGHLLNQRWPQVMKELMAFCFPLPSSLIPGFCLLRTFPRMNLSGCVLAPGTCLLGLTGCPGRGAGHGTAPAVLCLQPPDVTPKPLRDLSTWSLLSGSQEGAKHDPAWPKNWRDVWAPDGTGHVSSFPLNLSSITCDMETMAAAELRMPWGGVGAQRSFRASYPSAPRNKRTYTLLDGLEGALPCSDIHP